MIVGCTTTSIFIGILYTALLGTKKSMLTQDFKDTDSALSFRSE